MAWHGPYQIRRLLEKCLDDGQDWPGDRGGVYVITHRRWRDKPNHESGVLYVGGNTGKSQRFCTRIGDLIADVFGFYGAETGHHSGGQSIWKWCRRNHLNPLSLYIGWLTHARCNRCAEAIAYEALRPKLNKKKPAQCKEHR